MATFNKPFLTLLFLSLLPISFAEDNWLCVYTVYVRTGSVIKGSTDSVISLTVGDAYGGTVSIPNLVAWGGLMEPGHDYFERGDLDIFSGRGPCLIGPTCSMNLTWNGSGSGHRWYCNYVEVTSTGPHMGCQQKLFTVEQWLGPRSGTIGTI